MSSCAVSRDAEMRALFEALDRDKNGYVDKTELRETMQEVGLELSDADLDLMMKAAVFKDRLFYEDFIRLMTGSVGRLHRKAVTLKEISNGKLKGNRLNLKSTNEGPEGSDNPDTLAMRVAFALFDRNGDGILTEDEIEDTLRSLDVTISPQNIQTIIERVNQNANGALDFSDFRAVMSQYFLRCLSSSKPRSDCAAAVAKATASASLKDGGRSKAENGSSSKERSRKEEELVSAAFKIFDKDKDGFLNAVDLRSTMKQLGLILTEDDVRAMMRSVGVGPLGKLSYSDFCRIYRSKTDANAENNSLRRSNCRKKLPKRLETGKIFINLTSEILIGRNETADELRGVFEMFDLDDDGFITISEVNDVLRSMGISPSVDSIQDIFHQVDLDGNGKIDFREFLLLALKYERPLPEDRETREMFDALDQDRNGFIDSGDLKASFARLGIHLTSGDVHEMMNEVDAVDSGISFNDFVRILQKHFARRLRLFKSMKGLQVTDFVYDYESKEQESNKKRTIPVSDDKPTERCPAKPRDVSPVGSDQRRLKSDGVDASTVAAATSQLTIDEVNKEPVADQSKAINLTASSASIKITRNGWLSALEDRGSVDSSFNRNLGMRRGSRWDSIFTPSTVANFCRTNDSYSTTPNTWIAFKVFDRNADGYISKDELQQTMNELGVRLLEDELEMMMNEADVNKDGKIDYTEFSKLMKGSFDKYAQEATRLHELSQSQTAKSSTGLRTDDGSQRPCDEEIRTAFMVFDMDCNGLIDAEELRMTMTHLGKVFTETQVQEMIKAVDRNHDGKIDYKEFLEMMQLI